MPALAIALIVFLVLFLFGFPVIGAIAGLIILLVGFFGGRY